MNFSKGGHRWHGNIFWSQTLTPYFHWRFVYALSATFFFFFAHGPENKPHGRLWYQPGRRITSCVLSAPAQRNDPESRRAGPSGSLDAGRGASDMCTSVNRRGQWRAVQDPFLLPPGKRSLLLAGLFFRLTAGYSGSDSELCNLKMEGPCKIMPAHTFQLNISTLIVLVYLIRAIIWITVWNGTKGNGIWVVCLVVIN